MAVIRTKGNTFNFAQAVMPGAKGDAGDATGKADLVDGFVDPAQLPTTTLNEAGKIPLYDNTGHLSTAASSTPGSAVEYQQFADAIAGLGGGQYAKVNTFDLTAPAGATDTTTWITVTNMAETKGLSGERYKCDGRIRYTGPTGGGIALRVKGSSSAMTNRLNTTTFENGTVAPWTGSSKVTLAVDGTLAQTGTHSMKATVTADGTAVQQIFSEWVTAASGDVWSAGAQIRRVSSTSRTVRVDVQFGDSTGTVLPGSFLGQTVTPTTSAWTQGIIDSTHGQAPTAPAGTAFVRARLTIVTPGLNDVFNFDAIQLEQAAALPAYGNTSGSGSGALTVDIDVSGLAVGATTANEYTRTQTLTATGGSGVTFGALPAGAVLYLSGNVDIGGSGLFGQRIEFEYAQAAASGTTTLVAGDCTFARTRAA